MGKPGTVAFEIVPTSARDGEARLHHEGEKVRRLFEETGLWGRVNTILIPQLIAEEDDRPIALEEKLDPLEAKRCLQSPLPLDYILTQVTVFSPLDQLRQRIKSLLSADVNRVAFVGVPRVVHPEEVVGPYPTEALRLFAQEVPSRGVIFIPTRPDEVSRFAEKARAGATFGLCQLLFSDAVVNVARELSARPERPELLLSFGYVPQMETERGLIRWLIKDGSEAAKFEAQEVLRLAPQSLAEKKAHLVGLVRRILEQTAPLGFPLGLHFECPYGPSKPAMEVFAEVLRAYDEVLGRGWQRAAT